MKLATYTADDSNRLAVLLNEKYYDLARLIHIANVSIPPAERQSMEALINAGPDIWQAISEACENQMATSQLKPLMDIALTAPLLNPGKILCVGLNYKLHVDESPVDVNDTPVLFSKFNNAIASPNEAVPLPSNAEQYDYEVELAVVIGKEARYVSQENAMDYVFGYCNANDLSARDLQFRSPQWLLGKTPDKFLPLGPYIATADEIADSQNLDIRCWMNGELRQSSNTSKMIFPIAHIISYASQYMTLEPGDIICTGTPAGVILGMEDKLWIKPGDHVEVEVENLGRLANTFVEDDRE